MDRDALAHQWVELLPDSKLCVKTGLEVVEALSRLQPLAHCEDDGSINKRDIDRDQVDHALQAANVTLRQERAKQQERHQHQCDDVSHHVGRRVVELLSQGMTWISQQVDADRRSSARSGSTLPHDQKHKCQHWPDATGRENACDDCDLLPNLAHQLTSTNGLKWPRAAKCRSQAHQP